MPDGSGISAEPAWPNGAEQAGEEGLPRVPARLDIRGQVARGRVADQVQAGGEHKPVPGQVVDRPREVGDQVAVEKVAVVRLELVDVVDANRRFRRQLERPPRLPVVEDRHVRRHAWPADRVEAGQLMAEPYDLLPRG